MPTKKKTGKNRLDKYYHLAKEQGYRARSAFKLVQLNKKFNFLEKARCLVDLCAAPGGWLQVASKYMPMESLIIGIDLVPIKPIPKVITFAADITTEKCRAQLKKELKTWKVDVFLHDGAPNVGTAWVQDAYSQSELVLSSCKLATEFLVPQGTFVTKVFRSADYNNLLWVFNQLFSKVEATKPPSSRNVSAEIFVVCRGFKAPKKIDPKLLDPRYVFKEMDELVENRSMVINDLFKPDKRTRHRLGYAEGDYTLHSSVDVKSFIESDDPIKILASANEINISKNDSEIKELSVTTTEILECCKDLKVLGKSELKLLLKWRLKVRLLLGLDKEKNEGVIEVQEESKEGDVDIEMELENLTNEERRKLKRAKKRAAEKHRKEMERLQLKMITPTDIGLESQPELIFTKQPNMKSQTSLEWNECEMDDEFELNSSEEDSSKSDESENEDVLDSEDEEQQRVMLLEESVNQVYEDYKQRLEDKDPKITVKRQKRASLMEEGGEWTGCAPLNSDSEKSNESELSEDQDSDTDSDTDSDSGSDLGSIDQQLSDIDNFISNRDSQDSDLPSNPIVENARLSTAAKMWFDQPIFKNAEEFKESSSFQNNNDVEEEVIFDKINKQGKRSIKKEDAIKIKKRKVLEVTSEDKNEIEEVPKDNDDTLLPDISMFTPVAITMAQDLVYGRKSTSDLIDESFHRNSYPQEELPEWFMDDEKRHNKRHKPITKEAVQLLRQRMKNLNDRPIKKVVEAKARKKHRAVQKLNKLQAKAEAISENRDISESQKAESIKQMMQKAGRKSSKKEKITTVVAVGKNKGVAGRPAGVKGRYRIVDPRMKKELRAAKSKEKTKGRGKKGGHKRR